MPKIVIHNVKTGQIIEREMNDSELAQYNADQEAAKIAKQKADEAAAIKAALLERLGITEEEAKLLLA